MFGKSQIRVYIHENTGRSVYETAICPEVGKKGKQGSGGKRPGTGTTKTTLQRLLFRGRDNQIMILKKHIGKYAQGNRRHTRSDN